MIFYTNRYGITNKCIQGLSLNLKLFITFKSDPKLKFLLRLTSFYCSMTISLRIYQRFPSSA